MYIYFFAYILLRITERADHDKKYPYQICEGPDQIAHAQSDQGLCCPPKNPWILQKMSLDDKTPDHLCNVQLDLAERCLHMSKCQFSYVTD